MPSTDRSKAFCIIGAGASGLAAAKNFREWGIPFDCFERTGDIGGLWNPATPSGVVYETTHLVSSAKCTGFEDFPMDPARYPVYPSHGQALAYLKSYAEAFRLTEHIRLNTAILSVRPRDDGLWDVRVASEEEPRTYRGVVVANGHHDVPRMPQIAGTFTGEIMHSRSYTGPSQLIGKRVLVVGAGNSGCDIVRDAAHIAARVVLSIRRGYWFMPKFVLGFPTQEVASFLEAIPMPRIVRRYVYEAAQWLFVGPAERFGLPKPNYHFDEAHPTMSDEIPRLAAHGRLTVKPKIARFDGDRVVFGDGSEEAADLVVFATGYRPAFPFFEQDQFLDADGRCRLHLNVFHPEHPMLFAAGLSQANGSMWRLADYQAQLIARYITATEKAPEMSRWFIAHTAPGFVPAAKRWFVPSARHALEVNFYDYRSRLKRLIRMFDRRFSASGQTAPRAVLSARENRTVMPATIAPGPSGS
jgi:cation diffusion facilitator CzcD-associated flavoprotein CzcO